MVRGIIDAHSHCLPPEVARETTFFKIHWSDAEAQLRLMDRCGIERAVLLYPTSDAHLKMGERRLCRVYNEGIASLVARHPDRFVGAGIVPVGDPDGIEEILRGFDGLPLRLVSLPSSVEGVYLDDERFFPVYEFAARRALPIHVHAQIRHPIGEDRVRDPLLTPVLEYVLDVSMSVGRMMMSGTFDRFPEVRFIFAHYGGVLPSVRERFDTTYRMLRDRGLVRDLGRVPTEILSRIYCDTSGSASVASLLGALELVDPTHIVYGSDIPANRDPAAGASAVESAPIPDEDKQNILRGNMLRLLGE